MSNKINPKHRNQVRIIGGQWRGRKLTFAHAEGLRPTPDSVREKLFNWLGQDLTGQIVLDAFSGSGALGFEAASRHAKQVIMCDNHRPTAQHLRDSVRQLACAQQVEIHAQDGIAYLAQTTQRFDLVLLDPPFAWQNWAQLFSLLRDKLADNATVYIEAGNLPIIPDWLNVYRQGKAGQSQFMLLHYTQAIE